MESTAVEVMDLTVHEKSELVELETVIENGMRQFIDVGRALLQIRDGRLYRDTYRTFDDYCRDRWGMSKTHANRLIESSKATDNVAPIGVKPQNEAQARPLTRLKPEQRAAAWKEAVETAPDGKVTAAHVDGVVIKMEKKESCGSVIAEDTFTLSNLKTMWRSAKQEDRKNFIKWIRENYGKYI